MMQKASDKYTAVILAGGKNRRFNALLKPLAHLRGKTLLEHQLEVLKPLFEEILLITNNPGAFKSFPRLTVRSDIIHDLGPLGGIHSALHYAGQPWLFIVAGDMPFLQKNVIQQQIQLSRQYPDKAILPRKGTKAEPLHAIYPKTVRKTLEERIKSSGDRSIRSFLHYIPHYYWDIHDDTPFININTHEELRRYEANNDHKD